MDAQWLIWLGLAVAAGVIEIFTLSLVFVMVAGGAAAAALVAALTGDLPLAVLTFAAATGLLLVAVRPPLLSYSRRSGPGSTTGTAALVDRDAVVIQEVTSSAGLVKLSGEVWTARTAGVLQTSGRGAPPSGEVLEIGSRVRVVAIDGATAIVSPLAPPGPPSTSVPATPLPPVTPLPPATPLPPGGPSGPSASSDGPEPVA